MTLFRADTLRIVRRLVALLALVLLPITPVAAVDIPVLCTDRVSYELRTSNVIAGCLVGEVSLGEGAIVRSDLPVGEIDPTLQARFDVAKAAAAKEGVALRLVSGYRSLARQKYLFSDAIRKYGSYREAAKWVAPAELSHHPKGLAIDVNYPDEPDAARWLEVNGYKFGLCRVFKNEWWHFEGNIAPGWKCPKMYKNALALLRS